MNNSRRRIVKISIVRKKERLVHPPDGECGKADQPNKGQSRERGLGWCRRNRCGGHGHVLLHCIIRGEGDILCPVIVSSMLE